jgi:hypothetical protein
MKTYTKEEIKEMADKVITFADVPDGIAKKLAFYNIKYKGYYGYVNADTNEKIFVEA